MDVISNIFFFRSGGCKISILLSLFEGHDGPTIMGLNLGLEFLCIQIVPLLLFLFLWINEFMEVRKKCFFLFSN